MKLSSIFSITVLAFVFFLLFSTVLLLFISTPHSKSYKEPNIHKDQIVLHKFPANMKWPGTLQHVILQSASKIWHRDFYITRFVVYDAFRPITKQIIGIQHLCILPIQHEVIVIVDVLQSSEKMAKRVTCPTQQLTFVTCKDRDINIFSKETSAPTLFVELCMFVDR